MRPNRAVLARALIGVLALTAAACSAGATPAVPPGSAVPATVAPAASVKPSQATTTMEQVVVAAVAPKIDALTAALRSGDRQASLDALEAYDAGWNGVEVYINVRSKELYDKLEGDLQHQLEEGLAADAPDFANLATVSSQLATEFQKAILLAKDGPKISALFDDVTTLRIIRSDLRIANAALAAGDVAKARDHFVAFSAGFEKAAGLIDVRSEEGHAAVDAAFDKARAEFANSGATAGTLMPLAAALTSRFNFGVSLWNAAARNDDASKTTFTDADIAALEVLHDLEHEVGVAVEERAEGEYAVAKAEMAEALEGFENVEAILKAHNDADVTLKTALATFDELIAPDADQAKAATAGQTAYDAIFVARQVLVGPFWTDPALQAKIAALEEPGALGTPAPGVPGEKVSANAATVDEITAAFAAVGIPNADKWAAEVEEYRPYPDDPTWAKLRQELGKYNIDPAVLDKILSVLEP